MKETTAPQSTLSPKRDVASRNSEVGTNKSPSSVFISLALDMSWRLAIVVLVPIIGGFELDKRLHTSPLLVIVGFLLAMAGVALVLWQMLHIANQMPVDKKEKRQ